LDHVFMSHDIIVKQRGGSIDVETEPGLFTEFKIVLPRTTKANPPADSVKFAAVRESGCVQVFGCRHAETIPTLTGVRKAPRHEIAGCGAPTVQRALWGFGVGVSVGEVEPTLAIGSL
jgi:hypothetical protein